MPISPSYSSFFLFCGSTAFTVQVLLLGTVKRFLKYSYPGLCFVWQVQDIGQNSCFSIENPYKCKPTPTARTAIMANISHQ